MEQETSERLLMRDTIEEVKEELDKWKGKVWMLLRLLGYIDVDVDYEYGTVEVIKPTHIDYMFPLYAGVEFTGVSTEFSKRRFNDGMRIVEAALTSRLMVLSILPEIFEKFNVVRLEGAKKDMMWKSTKKMGTRVLKMPLQEARDKPEECRARLKELMANVSVGTVTIRIEGDVVKAIRGKGKRRMLLDLETVLMARSDKSGLYEEVVIGYKKPAFEEAVRVASMSIWPRSRLLNVLVDAVSNYNLIWIDARRERVWTGG
jgi:hypothetical protein